MALVIFMRGVNVGGAKRFQPTVLARELGEPFPNSASHLDLRRLVSVLAKRPRKPPALPWSYPAGEEPNTPLEKQFGVRATTRDWNTILRVCDVLQKNEG